MLGWYHQLAQRLQPWVRMFWWLALVWLLAFAGLMLCPQSALIDALLLSSLALSLCCLWLISLAYAGRRPPPSAADGRRFAGLRRFGYRLLASLLGIYLLAVLLVSWRALDLLQRAF